MNAAERVSCTLIEETFAGNSSFRKIEERLYVVKQGSTLIMINVVPWGEDKAVVRCIAQLVKGVDPAPELLQQLLEMNAVVRFGAFGFVPDDKVITFGHSILGGGSMDPQELLETIRDVAIIADEYDDRISAKYGGKTMMDLLEEFEYRRIFADELEKVWEKTRN